MFTLDATIRDGKQSPMSLRKKGMVPAVYYGKKEKSVPIAIDSIAFKKIWKKAGESSIITIKTGKGEIDSLLYEVQLDVVTGEPIHADFYAVDKDTEIYANVPLEFVGVSPAVKDLGGTLVKVLHEMEVKSLPKDLPHSIQIDISSLDTLESRISVKDLKLPKGVSTTENPNEVVASVAAAREEEEEPVAPIDLSSIEVEKKGKKEEEGAAPEGEEKASE
ncbi:MAG: 50S ribosomal protein L25 [Patescibacteria group bacterium]